MFAIPHWNGLRVLDRDVDWLEYRFHAPDFHPRVNSGRCELDRNVVQTTEVNRLIDVRKPDMTWRLGEISHLPRSLTQSFLNMYRSTLQQFQNELQNVPPPPPDRVIYLTQQIPILQAKINLLEQFEPRIGPFENMLAIRP